MDHKNFSLAVDILPPSIKIEPALDNDDAALGSNAKARSCGGADVEREAVIIRRCLNLRESRSEGSLSPTSTTDLPYHLS